MTEGNTQGSRIFVVGSGVVGAATGTGSRAAGHRVTVVDVAAPRVQAFRRGPDARPSLDLTEPDPRVLLTLPTPNVSAAHGLERVASREADAICRDAPSPRTVALPDLA